MSKLAQGSYEAFVALPGMARAREIFWLEASMMVRRGITQAWIGGLATYGSSFDEHPSTRIPLGGQEVFRASGFAGFQTFT